MEDDKFAAEKWKQSLGSVLNQYKPSAKKENEDSSKGGLQLKEMSDSDDDVDFRSQAEPLERPKTPPRPIVAQKALAHTIPQKCPAGNYGGKCLANEYATIPEDEDEMFDTGYSQPTDEKMVEEEESIFDLTKDEVTQFMSQTLPEWKSVMRKRCEEMIPPKEDEEVNIETAFVIFRRVFLTILFGAPVEFLDGMEPGEDAVIIASIARNALTDFVNSVPEDAPFTTMCINILDRIQQMDSGDDITVSSVAISKETFSYPESAKSACVVTGRIIEVGSQCHMAVFSAGSQSFQYAWKSGEYDGYVRTKFKMIGACLGVLDYIANCAEEFKKNNIEKTAERTKKMALVSGEGTKFIVQRFYDWWTLVKNN